MIKNLLPFILLLGCSVLPEGYKEFLIGPTWINLEPIATPTGIQNITRTIEFNANKIFEFTMTDPTATIPFLTETYLYKIGYLSPKYSIALFAYEDNIIPNPPTVGTPIFYRFEDNFETLITSSNANMSLPTRWKK